MEELYNIWFSSLDIKNSSKLDLLNKYNTKEIWSLDFNELVNCEIEEKDILEILKSKNLEEAKQILEKMIKNEVKLISVKDKRYPNKLHNIDDKPAFLYVRGNENIFDEDSVRNSRL